MPHTCPFCWSVAVRRVRRTLWQKCIYRRVYKCRCCGRIGCVLRIFAFGSTPKARLRAMSGVNPRRDRAYES